MTGEGSTEINLKIMKRISIHIFASLILLLQGCVREDRSECESGLLLRFKYTLNNQHTNLFDSQVNQITLYVFDCKGKYVDQFSQRGDVLTNNYVIRLPLAPGKYSIVGYGGDFTTYSIGEITNLNTIDNSLRKGITDISLLRVELDHISGDGGYLTPTHTPDDLYVGLVSDVASSTNSRAIVDMELIKITKKIKVQITGADLITRTSAPLDLYITALNGRYKYDHYTDPNYGTFKYVPTDALRQPNYMEFNFKIMRLILGQSPMLVIKNSTNSEVIYNEDMIEQVLSTLKYVSQEDFDREDEFVFQINIQSQDNRIVIAISINGWKINNINAEM